MIELQKFINELAEWSDETFGADRPAIAPIRHLQKEAQELLEDPEDDMEYIDCFMLLMDALRKNGGDATGLLNLANRKLQICRERTWEHTGDGVFERKGKKLESK